MQQIENKPGGHKFNDANAEVLLLHGVQADQSSRKQGFKLGEGYVGPDLHVLTGNDEIELEMSPNHQIIISEIASYFWGEQCTKHMHVQLNLLRQSKAVA